MKNRIERISQTVDILQKRNGASVKELAGELGVSEMTVRRDLEQLRLDNIVSLVHGAAIFKSDPSAKDQREYYLNLEQAVKNPEKERIGQRAAQMVQSGDVIFIDVGTTSEQMARHIPTVYPITVFCFTVNVLQEICKKKIDNLIMGGGFYHPGTQLFESPETISLIQRTRATKFFLSAAGISQELGLTCVNQYEVNVKQACIESSLQTILLADSRKFGRIRSAYFAALDKVDTVITDDGISLEWIKIMKDKGIKVLVT